MERIDSGILSCTIYAKLHMTIALSDNSISAGAGYYVQDGVVSKLQVKIILSHVGSRLLDVILLCQINLFIFEAAKITLNHDVIYPMTFSYMFCQMPFSLQNLYIVGWSTCSLDQNSAFAFLILEYFFKILMNILALGGSSIF